MPGQVKYLYIDLDFRANAAACFAMHIKNAPVTHLKISLRLYKLAKIDHPVAKGLAFGTSAHAVGTAKALELGEVEGAMSSLSIAVAGLLTVIAVPIASKFI